MEKLDSKIDSKMEKLEHKVIAELKELRADLRADMQQLLSRTHEIGSAVDNSASGRKPGR
jgi:hypothetical protein